MKNIIPSSIKCIIGKTYIFQLKITAYNFFIHKKNFAVTRVIEIEGNGKLQVTMLHLYIVDEVITLSLVHNDILNHIDYKKQQKEGLTMEMKYLKKKYVPK